MNRILIYEKLNDVKTLSKGRGEDGFMRLKGTFGVCGVRNQNSRIYTTENYKQMVDRIKARITNEGVPGQLEHPQGMNIDLNEISHVIEDINIDEKGLVTGTIKLLDTPKGKIAQALVEGGLPLFISSRATGSIDKNTGVVTLEELKTYDLVGTPGFSQARLDIAESLSKELGTNMISESLTDNIFIVESQEQTNEENKTEINMTEQEHNELLNKIELLEQTMEKANKRIEELGSSERMASIAEAIQNWVIKEFAPSLEGWLNEHYTAGIENWIKEEYTPEIKEQYTKQIAEGIQEWIVNECAPEIQNWITEEYTPTLDRWINEELMNDIKSKLNEGAKDKFASIDHILEMVEKNPAKPMVNRITENANTNEPLYVREMPMNVRPLWESADINMKEYIGRKARLYDLRTPEAISNFWEGIDWNKQIPVTPVYEGLEGITDAYERNLRASLRRHNPGMSQINK